MTSPQDTTQPAAGSEMTPEYCIEYRIGREGEWERQSDETYTDRDEAEEALYKIQGNLADALREGFTVRRVEEAEAVAERIRRMQSTEYRIAERRVTPWVACDGW